MIRGLFATAALLCVTHTAIAQRIDFESKYLGSAVAGFHGFRIEFELDGNVPAQGTLVMDPNACGLNGFGDRTICTRIAPTHEEVAVTELRVHDPTGQRRRVFDVRQHGLKGDLRLVTTTSIDDGWFVYQSANAVRTIVDLDPVRATPLGVAARSMASASCVPLPITVDGTTASHKVVAGFLNETWILLLQGKKPNGATRVDFEPLVYTKRPDYWEIIVSECSDGIVIPVVTSYDEAFEITPYLGHKGIELVFKDKRVRIGVSSSK